MENKIVLSPKKILNKQFQVDFKGYHAEEVDHFLDQVSADYTNFAAMLNESYEQIERLQRENQSLKKRINELERTSQEHVAQADLSSNVDLLRRLSQLEKTVYNKHED
ncbi:DivIVA domain-containing protein [Sharpea azabuensis]|jgi:DivIVA domain-containing protein|uniref:DivIVA domain-containing protein n=1 Tax=Sharpea porci TaxID=2652286 RepID=A0A844FQ32_9FIRM|nr:DivIVA domain-containing protein [Sharpea porci]MDD6711571.1 DivIVA domain-containing protein [Sharpea porci]MDY5279716.1 DivIVA domain-containing protein [Sharpea porci]MST88018.1 DivIVA domain-containing protein [Sharpea porci]